MAKTLAQTIIYENKQAVAAQIAAGADVNEQDEYGYTPLIEAAIMNKEDIGLVLLEAGADVQGRDLTGRTALHWTVDNNNISFSKELLNRSANANAYSTGGLSVLVMPLLRQQQPIKELLFHYGANLSFAQDFIYAKLLGHRFELQGSLDIYSPEGRFVEMEYEGFFLEFTFGLVRDSIERFLQNFAAKPYRQHFDQLKQLSFALNNAAALTRYQHFQIDVQDFKPQIHALLQRQPLIMPLGYEGHAISFLWYGNYWIKCDRGEARKRHGSIVLYQILHPERINFDFLTHLLYTPLSRQFIEQDLEELLGLSPIGQLPIQGQVIGNCSWANIEASVAAYLWFLFNLENPKELHDDNQDLSLDLFEFWREWDKDRALEECIDRFHHAEPARQYSIAALLASILFQTCTKAEAVDLERAEKILPILLQAEHSYILKSYVDTYVYGLRDERGRAFHHLLDLCGVDLKRLRENR